ncbi:hypothetical protein NDU88_002101 [Pleurodeles waltl]|uniref:Uncharacterized protein n=1 Tax=Pleurodeles waltl TaxID=8319 RepID=A0AAV7WMI8_PLEWA|nr:hypothetical protein NDU88_002101 [Pleurodeles waltl]
MKVFAISVEAASGIQLPAPLYLGAEGLQSDPGHRRSCARRVQPCDGAGHRERPVGGTYPATLLWCRPTRGPIAEHVPSHGPTGTSCAEVEDSAEASHSIVKSKGTGFIDY